MFQTSKTKEERKKPVTFLDFRTVTLDENKGGLYYRIIVWFQGSFPLKVQLPYIPL